jgi:hypothetical protein
MTADRSTNSSMNIGVDFVSASVPSGSPAPRRNGGGELGGQ